MTTVTSTTHPLAGCAICERILGIARDTHAATGKPATVEHSEAGVRHVAIARPERRVLDRTRRAFAVTTDTGHGITDGVDTVPVSDGQAARDRAYAHNHAAGFEPEPAELRKPAPRLRLDPMPTPSLIVDPTDPNHAIVDGQPAGAVRFLARDAVADWRAPTVSELEGAPIVGYAPNPFRFNRRGKG